MAFWGVEVKPGKPVTHSCENAKGRLRISQAALGISDATKKSIVQCNVGKKSPVILCVLLPNHTESCHLDLEFEEAVDVVFSVIGPQSVYLTGYYVRQNQQPNARSDSESYGMDIADTQTEESSYNSDDDKYEDSFIDDDEMKDVSPSPVLNGKVSDKLKDGKVRVRRLQKKHQVVESDMDASSHESEDEDGYLLSVFKNKRAAKTNLAGTEANSINKVLPASSEKDQMHSQDIAKPKRKRKELSEEEITCEVQIDKDHEVEASKNLREAGDHNLVSPSESRHVTKSKKRRKEKLDVACTEGIAEEINNVAEDDKLKQDSQHSDDEKESLPAANGDQELQIDNQPGKKTKKKTKKKKQSKGDLNMALPDMTNNQENRCAAFENQSIAAREMQSRTLSNGLIIEEVASGPPDGKVASLGKKVKIFYTAMLKENGRIFDSNVGKSPCKFRLGDKEITDGWNLGIEGMHVGDKRRLIIPPSMCSGMGENVPPKSWLVYDVELAGIRK